MMVLDDKCKVCNCICNSIYFQQNFGNWIKNWGGLKINYFRNFLNGIRLRGKTEKGRIY